MTPRDDDRRVADLEAEIASHLLHAEADLRARGRDAREAAHEARRTFGNVRIVTDATHRQWAAEPLAAGKRGWRLARRSVREAPAAAAGAVLALSAALTAVGTLGVVFDRLWWRPVPGVLAPERVVRVYGAGFWTAPTRAFVEYLDLREGASTLAGVAAYRVQPQSVDVRGRVARLRVAEVTSDYFEVLGVPLVGAPPDAHGCVVSTAVARQAERTPGDLLGSALQVGARRTQVRGVAAAAFEGVDLGTVDLWCALPDLPRDRGAYDGVHVIGRLRTGVTRDDADRDVNRVSRAGWQRDGQPLDANVMQLGPLAMTRGVTRPVDVDVVRWLLVLAVSLLLAAVGTVSTVLLTRTLAAGPTRAVRVVLGASRWRLAREPLMAGVVLGGLSAPLALVVTSLLVSRLVPHLLAYERTWYLALDGALALVALALCSGLLAGSLAAARSYPTRLSTYLADMRTQRLTSPRLLRAVLVAQTTVAMVLLVAALHVVGGFTRIAAEPLGLQLDGLHVVTVESLTPGHPAREARWLEALLVDAQALGEVEGAALTHTVPFQSSWRTRAHIEGRDPPRCPLLVARGWELGARWPVPGAR